MTRLLSGFKITSWCMGADIGGVYLTELDFGIQFKQITWPLVIDILAKFLASSTWDGKKGHHQSVMSFFVMIAISSLE